MEKEVNHEQNTEGVAKTWWFLNLTKVIGISGYNYNETFIWLQKTNQDTMPYAVFSISKSRSIQQNILNLTYVEHE